MSPSRQPRPRATERVRSAAGLALAGAVAWVAFFVNPSTATAAPEDAVGIALQYRASTDCPNEAAFVGEVAMRTARLRFQSEGAGTGVVELEIKREGSAFLGTLRLPGAEARTLRADTCQDAVAVFALILALAYDPDAKQVETPLSADVKPAPVPTITPVASVPTVRPLPPQPPARSPAPGPSRSFVGLGAHLEASSFASASFGLRVFASLTIPREGLWAASFRLSVARTLPSVLDGVNGGQGGTLIMNDVEVEGCFMQWPPRAALVRFCAWGLGGFVQSEGRGPSPKSALAPWASAGIATPLTWSPWRSLRLELRPAVGRTLLFDRYYFEPNTTVYEAPILYVRVGVGASVQFP